MKKRRNTMILTAVLLAAALGGLAAQRVFFRREGSYACVQSHDRVIARLTLDRDAVLPVGDGKNGYNLIEVRGGAVSVTQADCPDRICVREGAKRYGGETIVCLPHRLIVTVEAGDGRAPDAMSR